MNTKRHTTTSSACYGGGKVSFWIEGEPTVSKESHKIPVLLSIKSMIVTTNVLSVCVLSSSTVTLGK